jgi:hypothetical protein
MGEMLSGPDVGKRFCANTKAGDHAAIAWLMGADRIGQEMNVHYTGPASEEEVARVWCTPVVAGGGGGVGAATAASKL